MKIYFATLLVLGLVVGSAVSQAALPGQFPSHAGLVFLNRFCDATVLNNRHVLTAATCALNANNERLAPTVYTLFVSTVNIVQGATGMAVSHVFVHEHYNPDEQWNNVAVLRTTADINFNPAPPLPPVEAVEFYTRIVPDTAPCTLVGWNSPPQHLNVPLQHQQQNIFNRDHCNTLNEIAGRVQNSMICAGSVVGNPNPCANNPGGALYCDNRLVAIMSHNRRCGQPNAPGVYTAIRFHSTWIQQQFNRTDLPAAGPTPAPGHPNLGGSGNALKSSFFVLLSLLALRLFA
ncbi:trypsin 3A1-like [Phlebotomus argentipes]|uniref:trypsin 3A1-like n=1 Tax=Phlebotomus argentipes TaxID=94469 RepID=UPI002892D956|nr:trypsin 3A1-like [Phlebotomus argentipes]